MHTPCENKVQYGTMKKAIKAKDRFLNSARGGLPGVNLKQHAYRCSECGHWHLTTRPRVKGRSADQLVDVQPNDIWRVHDADGEQYQARVTAVDGRDVTVQSLRDGSPAIYDINHFKSTSDGFLLSERRTVWRSPK